MSEPVGLPGLKRRPHTTVVTVGTFDGVHRGHQTVLASLVEVARQRRKQSVVVTFDPHPLYVVRPVHAPQLLCTTREKTAILRDSDVDDVAVIPFTRALADYAPREFVEQVLIGHFGLEHLVIGYDHGFGKDRSGDVATLQQIGRELGFEVTVVPHTDLDGSPVSSTRIRKLLLAGDVVTAARALGRPYSVEGPVIRGDQRGRALGFPTANIQLLDPQKLLPAEGIYAVRVDRQGARHDGVLHLGPRPTFEGAVPTIEAFLFDFDGDLYGQRLRVDFIERIRGVERFDTVEALIDAMHGDVAAARRILG